MASSSDPSLNDQSPFLLSPSLLAINGKIAVSALAVLFIASLCIIALHFYTRWSWWRRRSIRRSHSLPFALQQSSSSCTGLHKDVVQSLPTFHYKCEPFHLASAAHAVECAVCLSEFQDNEECRLLPKCNHSFHTQCIDMWFLSNSTCPLCRCSADPSANEDGHEKSISIAWLLSHQDRGNQPYQDEISSEGHVSGGMEVVGRNRSHSMRQVQNRDRERPISDRFAGPREIIPFPTNVLFWGDGDHLNSRENTDVRLAQGRSDPHITLDLSRQEVVSASTTLRCHPHECHSSGASSLQHHPSSHLTSLKRLLSREKKPVPSDAGTSGNGGGTLNAAMVL